MTTHPHRSTKFLALRRWWSARNAQPIRCYGSQVQYRDLDLASAQYGEWRHLAHLSEIVETPEGAFAAQGQALAPYA